MQEFRTLIVDDDAALSNGLKAVFQSSGLTAETTGSKAGALAKIHDNPGAYGVLVLDYHLPDGEGVQVAHTFRSLNPGGFALMFSGDNSREALKASMQAGASDFFDKGEDLTNLVAAVKALARRYAEARRTRRATPSDNESALAALGLAGRSSVMAGIARDVQTHRSHRYTVFLLGESGTGKECFARALHDGPDSRFLAVNCAAYRDNATLLESELFGHEKGAFTGADRLKKGMFELAHGGTLFLDEIHELSVSAQAKLLRVLQEKKIRRVGGNTEIAVDVKVVAAAKPAIEKKRESGEFLPDLYNRLYVFPITLPPLRERPEDVEPLVRHFVEKYNRELGKSVEFTPGVIKAMEGAPWPGNVRELENTCLRMVVSSRTGKVEEKDFDGGQAAVVGGEVPPRSLEEIRERFETMERDFISRALIKSRRNLRQAARDLGISHTTLHAKVKKYGLNNEGRA